MIDFLRYRIHTFIFSLTILIGFCVVAAYRYYERGSVFVLSVDFTGGTQILLHFNQQIDSSRIKHIVESAGWRGASARNFSKEDVVVRVTEASGAATEVAHRVVDTIRAALPEYAIEIKQTEHVGEGVGNQVWARALIAIAIALVAMLVYIAVRFMRFSYALGAVVSLFHDAVAILALFLILDREISVEVIGAILAVLGYSINDTIVIFSRIRNMRATHPGMPLTQLVNQSINDTLRRTVLTTLATALSVVPMLLLGGEALFDFAMALFVGIAFGVYSTIYMASPVMLLLEPEVA